MGSRSHFAARISVQPQDGHRNSAPHRAAISPEDPDGQPARQRAHYDAVARAATHPAATEPLSVRPTGALRCLPRTHTDATFSLEHLVARPERALLAYLRMYVSNEMKELPSVTATACMEATKC